MSQVKPTPFTIHDYRQLPDDGPRYQVIEGELHRMPSQSTFHQAIVGNVLFMLRCFLNDHPVGDFIQAPFDVYLDHLNVFQPDILFVTNERIALFTDTGVEGAPDLVVEILTPSSAELDCGPKHAIYARTGVKELWIVDPIAFTIQVYRLQVNAEHPEATYNATAFFTSPLLPGLTVSAAEIFQA